MTQVANYHTHTRWCKHAVGEIEEYIDTAIANGLTELAITEHVPHEDNHDPRRLQWEEFSAYDAALNAAIERYKNKITIYKGWECEFYPSSLAAYDYFAKEHGYELFVLGQHRSGANREIDHFAPKGKREIQIYADEVSEALETERFHFLAHPDLCLVGYPNWDDYAQGVMKQIFEVCERLDIPVEINANGLRDRREYPDNRAFDLSKGYNLRYLINSDAHDPNHMIGEPIAKAEAFAAELGISVIPYFNDFKKGDRHG